MNFNKIIAREILVLFTVVLITLGIYGYYQIQNYRIVTLLNKNNRLNELKDHLKFSDRLYDFYLKSQNGYEFWVFAKSTGNYTKSFQEFSQKYSCNQDKLFKITISNSEVFHSYITYFNEKCYNCEIFGNPSYPLQVYIINNQNFELFKKYFFPKPLIGSAGKKINKKEFLNKLKHIIEKFPNVNSEDKLLARRFFNNFSHGNPTEDIYFSSRIKTDIQITEQSLNKLIEDNNLEIIPLKKYNYSSEELFDLIKDVFYYLFLLLFFLRYVYYIVSWSLRTLKS